MHKYKTLRVNIHTFDYNKFTNNLLDAKIKNKDNTDLDEKI